MPVVVRGFNLVHNKRHDPEGLLTLSLRGAVATKQSPELRRLPGTFQVLAMTAEYARFAEGKTKMPGPGRSDIVFRHCEESLSNRDDVAISKKEIASPRLIGIRKDSEKQDEWAACE